MLCLRNVSPSDSIGPSLSFRKYVAHEQNFLSYLKNTTIWSTYLSQLECGEKGKVQCEFAHIQVDPTVPPLIYSLHLFSSALKRAHLKKCKKNNIDDKRICQSLRSMPPEEWRSILEESTCTAEDGQRIRFFMDMDSLVNVIAHDGKDLFQLVRASLESLNISTEGVRQLSYGRHNSFLD